MKLKHQHYGVAFLMLTFLFSGCGTICGGSKYYARVQVKNHPDATISYKGRDMGTGDVMFSVPRREANNFTITMHKEGCESDTKTFHGRTFRTAAFIGTLVTWTGFLPGTIIPLPWGILVDGATGALWKPDIHEDGVKKQNYKHFIYTVNYKGCGNDYQYDKPLTPPAPLTKSDKLRELKKLLYEKVITQQEFEVEKKKLLES